jgi:glycogen debranching enzyme
VVFSLEEKEALFSTLKRLYLAWEGISGENKICRYVHPWDSGMDNSTAFDNILPISTPDLNVHIITLLQCLSILSAELGLSEESMRFAKTAKNYFHHFMRLSWNGNEFTSVTDSGMQMTSNASCKFIPFILGSLLSKETIEKMKAQLFRDGFVTRWSIATESTRSDKYDTRQGDTFKPSAYWRGPIWPYIVYLVVDGLIGCGEKDTAKDISRRFCDVVEKNCEGIYENYDALSGQGFDDSCDQWTAAVYLIFKADEAKQRLT